MKIFRDPLIHFLMFGVLLFGAHGLWSSYVDRADRELRVDTREIARQSDLFVIENSRAPSEAELQGIIVAHVEEEVLAREAMKLGLDVDDTVIRRRLAQKMRMLTDAGPIDPPEARALQSWFDARRDDYAVAERRIVQHIFYSTDKRVDPVGDASQADLSDWARAGDPFIVARQFGPVPRTKVAQDYGADFAEATFRIAPGDWSEPVRSPFGVHRIRVTEVQPATAPELTDIHDRVLRDWTEAARSNRAAQDLRDRVSRYDVIVSE